MKIIRKLNGYFRKSYRRQLQLYFTVAAAVPLFISGFVLVGLFRSQATRDLARQDLEALRLGAVDYILKPFEDGQLEGTIQRLLEEEILEGKGSAGGLSTVPQEDPDERILPLRGEEDGMNRYVRSAIRFIQAHYREEGISISTVAAGIGVSEGHLSRLFKKDTGMSVSTYVTTFRIRKAMRLLRDVQYRVSEVAGMVGYQDVAYFSSTFRKLTGMSPTQFQGRE